MSRQDAVLKDNLLFKPGIIRYKHFTDPVRELSLFDIKETNTNLSSSFRYDSPGSALKSTQQLNVDFSDFSKHTFFNSAAAKTQKAFSKIINSYPFDGTKSEITSFVESLTGYEKYVLDNFPKNNGYLNFSGSSGASGGTYLSVNDYKGSSAYNLTKNPTGESVLDPQSKSFTIEFYLSTPQQTNDNQIILQKLSGSEGITLCLSSSASKSSPTTTADFYALIKSGTLTLTSSFEITKNEFNHIAVVYDNQTSAGKIKLFKNGVFVNSSSEGRVNSIDFKNSPLLIGSGTSHSIYNYSFTPQQTLSGAIDELRFWHKAKTQREIEDERYTNVFADDYLKLLFRFNEPSGTFNGTGGSTVLDNSGNGLHSTIQNFSMNLRNTSSFGSSPITQQSDAANIALFPSYQPIVTLKSSLLNYSNDYDISNPNLVTKLVPPHYLKQASQVEGFEKEIGNIDRSLSNTEDMPGGNNMGQPQIIAGILYTFAETFDEMKMFVDEFKRLLKVDLLTQDTISNQLLPWLSRYYGISVPNLFSNSTITQFVDGNNIRQDRLNTTSLQTVQSILWRRIFSDLPFIFSTRGTHASIRSMLSNLGISSNGPVRVREFGGSKNRTLGDSYIKRHEVAAMINMSGTNASQGSLSVQGYDTNRPYIISNFLSGTRVEPGEPIAAGNVSSSGSSNTSDGLFTSGSWSFEGIYKFDNKISHGYKQSLVRLCTTGTNSFSNKQGLVCNVLANKTNNLITGSLVLYAKTNTGSNGQMLTLTLSGVDIFDGQKWNVSFGKFRNDFIDSHVSSSYFLKAGKFSPSGLEQYYSTSSYFYDEPDNVLQKISQFNTSGTFVTIGSQSIDSTSTSFLNNSSLDDDVRYTNFTGKMSSLRFWSKGLDDNEFKTHVRNYKSLGVADPELNFNFNTTESGSFERLRLDVSIDQPVTKSDGSGQMTLIDFSQNDKNMLGFSFESSKQIINPERFDFEVLSSIFESGENPNKVRIRSFIDLEDAEKFGVSVAPLSQIPQNDEPNDDRRVSIEVSITQALNEDIMTIFSTLDALDTIIGSPELLYAQEYPHLRNLRRIYFNRLTQKINLQSFFEFFKWFDDTIIDLIEQMLPSNARFSGNTYVIESHALERPKFSYKTYDMYLGEEDRAGKDTLLLQFLDGTIRKL